MPMPTPEKDEDEKTFVSRCMGTEMMKKDFPDNDQRLAVCYKQFKKDKEEKTMEEIIERRVMPESELRVDGKKEKRIVGYAAVFDALSEVMFGFREKIRRGAFTESIQRDDVRALFNHDPNYVLGRNKAGTLTLSEDDRGLSFEITPPDTQWAKDLMVSIKRGDVNQNSFGFSIADKGEEWDQEEKVRTLTKVKLYDISPVTYPAYPQTEAYVRAKGNFYILPQDRLFISEPNPTVTILSKGNGNNEAKPTVVIPQPQFMDPDFWAMFENLTNRRK